METNDLEHGESENLDRPELSEDPDTGLSLSSLDTHAISPWSKRARKRAFYFLFVVVTIGLVLLLYPFTFTIVFGAATAVVAAPLRHGIERRFGVSTGLAALATVVLVCLGVVLPLMLSAAYLMHDVSMLLDATLDWMEDKEMPASIDVWLDRIRSPTPLEAVVTQLPWQIAEVPGFAPAIGRLVGWFGNAALDLVVYLMVTYSLLREGDRVMRLCVEMVPIDPVHGARLFQAFREIARNFMVGTVATALLQAGVAGLGWWLAGLPNTPLFAFCIALSSLVPMVGTLVAWGPGAVIAFVLIGPKAALFVVAWNTLFTGVVDNIAKPLFLRGRSELHPVAVFLAVFSGWLWFGLPGLLIGPMAVAAFTALFRIHRETFLNLAEPVPEERKTLLALVRALRSVEPGPVR